MNLQAIIQIDSWFHKATHPSLTLNPPATKPCSENSNARQLRMKKKIDSENRREILNLSLGPTQIEECEEILEVSSLKIINFCILILIIIYYTSLRELRLLLY